MMTDKLLEQVSALADDELGSREAELLLARMGRDVSLRDAWERYHLVGEAMRGSLPAARFRNLAGGVSAAIERDNAPGDVPASPIRKLLQPVGGFVVAASVAMLAVFTLQMPRDNAPADVVVTSGGRAPVAALPGRAQAVDFSGVRSEELQNQLRSYLLNHSEHSGSPRMRGVMPYVQLAAHDSRPIKTADDQHEATDPEHRD